MNNRQLLLEIMKLRAPKYKPNSGNFGNKVDRTILIMEGKHILFENVQSITDKLDAINILYAVIGGLAAIYHGSPRTTVDIDLLVYDKDVDYIARTIVNYDLL